MNFQDLRKIENPDFYLDIAFRRAKEKAEIYRKKVRFTTKLEKSVKMERYKLEIMKESLVNSMQKIIDIFPKLDELPEFYKELVKLTMDYDALKNSLGAVNWAKGRVLHFYSIYKNKIRDSSNPTEINAYRREFSGRASSVLKQIGKELRNIEEGRKTMKQFPNVKTSIPTIAIAGFPNVGKTTLLARLTGSKPDIQPYAFTTRGINVGYLLKGEQKIQILDTPGTLNRFNKMNNIEKQSYLAIKLCAEKIIYIFDLTEASSPLDQQIELFQSMKEFNKDIICYMSKTDLIDKATARSFAKKYKCISDADELAKAI